MNTSAKASEFAEWLRKGVEEWREELRSRRDEVPQHTYQVGYARGYYSALGDVLDHLATLDSSHDLPSTKG